ncbi:MAG: MGMT family protein [Halomonas sp.]|nr:MGMT family protein [Halomonas sp.]
MPRHDLLEQIYTIVAQIPPGRVTTYGRVAKMTEGATPRMVGSAMAKLPDGHGLPWHRVVNAGLKVTDHPGASVQRERLSAEGVAFDGRGRISGERLWP